MRNRYWNIFLVAIFFVVTVVVYTLGNNYKLMQSKAYKNKYYSELATSVTSKFKTLIEEKRNATLTIALSLAQNQEFKMLFLDKDDKQRVLSQFSEKLSQETDFKNVWIHLVDAKGFTLSRSWSDRRGDDLKKVRSDVVQMCADPKITSSLSVGLFDLSIKAMIPLYDEKKKYLGFLEAITHFNSIDKKMQEIGWKSVVLVDKSYKKQLLFPFTNKFVGDYYVASKYADDETLAYIQKEGIETFTNYTKNYSLDAKGRYLRVHYTLFGENEKPMAYVVMLKDTKEITTKTIDDTNFIVNMFMIFAVITVGFLLILMRDKNRESFGEDSKTFQYFFFFLILFLAVVFVYYLLLESYKTNEQENYLKSYNINVEKDYEIIQKKFQTVANMMFDTSVNNKIVLKLMHLAYTKDKDVARAKLYALLKEKYNYIQKYNARQFHFHLSNCESFLRFHRPEQYGDSLLGVRQTVEWVNENHMPIEGFEEGRIYNGFRYVFPLEYTDENTEEEHVGSVEISFSAHSIAKEFAALYSAKIGFLVSKEAVSSKVFENEQINYSKSEFKDFYYEKSVKKELEHRFEYFNVNNLLKSDLENINQKIFEGYVFSIEGKDGNALYTFLPLKNPVTKKVVAFVVIERDDRVLAQQNDFFFFLFSVGTVLFLLLIIFIFREYIQKMKFLDLSFKAQRILDMQESIIIVTNGSVIFDVNKKFLEFFGYKSLEEFKIDYECICERFIEDDYYYHLGKVPSGLNWVQQMEHINEKERVALMQDKNGQEHSFMITASQYKHDYFIVTFTDITGRMLEQFILEDKIMRDKLTDAYNREFFEKQIDKVIAENKQKNRLLGILFFDIDHFKEVNDKYGHNMGDFVLKELAMRVKESIRSDDYLIRWGGEEFIVLLSTKSLQEAETSAEHLRSMIENHHFDGLEKITCSFGVTLHNNEPITQTIERADKALYLSKENGRNLVTKL